MTYRKIGGLHFIRVGRVQFSFCKVRAAKPAPDRIRIIDPISGIIGGISLATGALTIALLIAEHI